MDHTKYMVFSMVYMHIINTRVILENLKFTQWKSLHEAYKISLCYFLILKFSRATYFMILRFPYQPTLFLPTSSKTIQ